MAHFGDLVAHQKILEEIQASDAADDLMGCMRGVAMCAFGSFHGLDTMHDSFASPRHAAEFPTLRAILSVASLTASLSQGIRGLEDEVTRCTAMLDGELSRITFAREQIAVQSAATHHVNVSFGAAVSTIQIGGGASSTAAVRELQAKLESQCEMTMYMQAYVQFIRGFMELWDELFGRHYTFPSHVVKTGFESPSSAASSSVAEQPSCNEGGENCKAPELEHNCSPPHLYAVNWKCVLTPERREWIDGQHDMTRELLLRVITREMPLEAYLLYQLHASMTLRLRLLEAVAQLFVWSSCYMDVIVCVQQLYTVYRLQCEMARLQVLWSSFKLFDTAFLRECETFNSSCSEDQGAVIEHMFFESSNLAPSKARPDAMPSGLGTGVAPAGLTSTPPHSTHELALAAVHPSEEFQASSGDESVSVASSHSVGAETGISPATPRREFYTPLFPTRCHFTWLLQRACWSMYGRNSLLFSSCLHAERVYDGTALLRPPPTMAELAGTTLSRSLSPRSSRLDGGKTSKAGPRSRSGLSAKVGDAMSESAVTPATLTEPTGGRQPRVRPGVSPGLPTPGSARAQVSRTSPSPRQPALDVATRAAAVPPAAPPPEHTVAQPGVASASVTEPRSERRASQSTTGWRGVLQALLHPERSHEPSHTRQAEAVLSVAGETPRSATSVRTRSRESALVPGACLYDSQSQPVEGIAPFFFHYSKKPVTLDRPATEAAAATADGAKAEAEGESTAPGPDRVSDGDNKPSLDYVFLKRCGCYVLAIAIRKALEAQRYPATLVVVTDNTTREGRVHWRQNRIVPLAATKNDPEARAGIAPWVLNFVFPGSRLSNDVVVRDQQQRRLFQTVVFQVAGTDSSRVCFPAYNSLFFSLNSGPLFDSGRLYFVMHLSMPDAEARAHHSGRHDAAKEVRDAAYAGLEEISQGWAMNCTCNEAMRLLPSVRGAAAR